MKQLASLLPLTPKQRKPISPKPISKRHLQLVNLAGDLAEQTREEAGTLGFMSRLLVMVNLPYRDPGKDKRTWWRKNGAVSIDVNSGTKEGVFIGLPYGAYPRLILAYLVTQAIKTQSPEIFLGKSFNHFLNMMKIKNGGTTQKRLSEQLKRTLSASFAWTYSTKKRWSRINVQVASQSQLWWDEKEHAHDNLWESYIRLNMDFYNEIMRNAIPLDLRVLATLKNSPLGLDLYMFIAWRTFKIDTPVFIGWDSLQEQLGGQFTDLKEFARKCRSHINKIQAIRPDLNVTFIRGRLCLKPSLL